MEVAEVVENTAPRILASEREVTRLGASVFHTGRISPESLEFLCGVLTRMSAIYRRFEVMAVRAVATAAVRDAGNQAEFLARTSSVLGTEVEIISGQEEARLIHLGIATRWPHGDQRFLAIDIGGGSAEIILSENDRMSQAFSRPLGALRLQELFLKSDPPKPEELHRLEEYIAERMSPAVRRIQDLPINRVIGTSATASAVVCAVNRIPRARRDEGDRRRATTAQIRKLYRQIRELPMQERQRITGIGPRRAEIIIPGTAVLLHLLEALNMPSIFYSAAGVRDGIVADLVTRGAGREQMQLTPDQRATVESMASRYGVSQRHARRVARLASSLFVSLHELHRLPPSGGRLLEAAAYLHDIGHFVSDTRHHKHSYYLVSNSDMAGFTGAEREMIANLCRYHRKASPAPEHSNLQPLAVEERRAVMLLMPILRLADSLDRSHGQRVRGVQCSIRDQEVVVTLDAAEGADIDLELWAGERIAEMFRLVYGLPLILRK
jgi:exopolyphosphatase/guanosine-5'-triphosphate,3'-diphosphate pyrophosphatase